MRNIRILFCSVVVGVTSIIAILKYNSEKNDDALHSKTKNAPKISIKNHTEIIADTYIKYVTQNIWSRDGWKMPGRVIDIEFMGVCSNDLEKREGLLKCVEAFLSIDLKIDEFMTHGGRYNHYILYCRDLMTKMHECDINESIRVETFFSMIEKYKLFCLQKISNDITEERQKVLLLIGALDYLKNLFKSDLSRVDREIFTSYLVGLSKESQLLVKARFAEFCKRAIREVEMSKRQVKVIKRVGGY